MENKSPKNNEFYSHRCFTKLWYAKLLIYLHLVQKYAKKVVKLKKKLMTKRGIALPTIYFLLLLTFHTISEAQLQIMDANTEKGVLQSHFFHANKNDNTLY